MRPLIVLALIFLTGCSYPGDAKATRSDPRGMRQSADDGEAQRPAGLCSGPPCSTCTWRGSASGSGHARSFQIAARFTITSTAFSMS